MRNREKEMKYLLNGEYKIPAGRVLQETSSDHGPLPLLDSDLTFTLYSVPGWSFLSTTVMESDTTLHCLLPSDIDTRCFNPNHLPSPAKSNLKIHLKGNLIFFLKNI